MTQTRRLPRHDPALELRLRDAARVRPGHGAAS